MNRRIILLLSAFILAIAIIIVIGLGGFVPRWGNRLEYTNVAFDISPDGQQIVFSSAYGDLYLFNRQDSRLFRLTDTARIESTPAFSPDGKFIVYAVNEGGKKDSHIYVCSIDGQQIHQLTHDPGVYDCLPSYSRDGSQIVFARAHLHRPYSMGGWTWNDWDVYVMKSDGKQINRLTQEKYYDIGSPKFFRDTQFIVYSANTRNANGDLINILFEVATNGNQPPAEHANNHPNNSKANAWGSEPDVAADGSSITFISDRNGPFQYDVFVMFPDGTNPRPLGVTSVSSYNKSPRFHPNGKTILFLAETEREVNSRPICSLWQVDTDGQNPHLVMPSNTLSNPTNANKP